METEKTQGDGSSNQPVRRRRTKSKNQRKREAKQKKQQIRGWTAIVIITIFCFVIYNVSKTDSNETTNTSSPLAEVVKKTPENLTVDSTAEADLKEEKNFSTHTQENVAAQKTANAFISNTNLQRRLGMVRTPKLVKKHLNHYSDEALKTAGTSAKLVSTGSHNGSPLTTFSVSLPNNSSRLLNVLETADGPKVDWDSYARYCSLSWDTLTSPDCSESALVRVVVSPGSHYQGQYSDQKAWICFKLETPDCNEDLYAYGRVDDEATEQMQAAILQTKNYRQHMLLKVQAKGSDSDLRLFQVNQLIALGWIQ